MSSQNDRFTWSEFKRVVEAKCRRHLTEVEWAFVEELGGFNPEIIESQDVFWDDVDDLVTRLGRVRHRLTPATSQKPATRPAFAGMPPSSEPDPRWELSRDLARERAGDIDWPTAPFFDVTHESKRGAEPIWMHSPRFRYPFGVDVPFPTITIEFDHRISKNTLKSWLDRAYPEMKRSKDKDGRTVEPIIQESRATWNPKTLELIRYVCLEIGGLSWMGRSMTCTGDVSPPLPRETSWRQRWVGWNQTRPKKWRFTSQNAFHKRFLEIERDFTGWPFGLAWFYDPMERMRLGNERERERFDELVTAGDAQAIRLAGRAKQRQEDTRKKQEVFKQWMVDGFGRVGPLMSERNAEFHGPPPTSFSESPALNMAREAKRPIKSQPDEVTHYDDAMRQVLKMAKSDNNDTSGGVGMARRRGESAVPKSKDG